MVELGQLAFGAFLIVGGALVAIDHPVVDWLNRLSKAAGTTQQPSDIEMNESSRMVGFFVGALTIVVGLMLVAVAVA